MGQNRQRKCARDVIASRKYHLNRWQQRMSDNVNIDERVDWHLRQCCRLGVVHNWRHRRRGRGGTQGGWTGGPQFNYANDPQKWWCHLWTPLINTNRMNRWLDIRELTLQLAWREAKGWRITRLPWRLPRGGFPWRPPSPRGEFPGRPPREGLPGLPWMAPKGGLPELPACLTWLPGLMLARWSPSSLSHGDEGVGLLRILQIRKKLSALMILMCFQL